VQCASMARARAPVALCQLLLVYGPCNLKRGRWLRPAVHSSATAAWAVELTPGASSSLANLIAVPYVPSITECLRSLLLGSIQPVPVIVLHCSRLIVIP